MSKELILVLGGARSGKSDFALKLAQEAGGRLLYVATAQPGDEEMRCRIARHRRVRSQSWRLLEEPLAIGAALAPLLDDADVVLIDCLTIWVSNLLLSALPGGIVGGPVEAAAAERVVDEAIDALLQSYGDGTASLIVVSNEVGLGLVPEHPLGRLFRDALGRANQRVAAQADKVYLLVAGMAVDVCAFRRAAGPCRGSSLGTNDRGVCKWR
jgi:adenosylcobinamide kinase/adenosylcobinamide-phosphate guanylyltransferase